MNSLILLIYNKINFSFELFVYVMMFIMILKDIILKMLCVLLFGIIYIDS